MEPKLLTILKIFITLLIFLFFGCAAGQKTYDGPKLPHVQTSRIICETRPIEIQTIPTINPTQITWRSWRVDPGYFASSWTLEVLPGTYKIIFEIPDPPYVKRVSHTITVEAGHNYRVQCYKTGPLFVKEI